MKTNFLLHIQTPDSLEELEEEHSSIESMQRRKDELFALPWSVTGLYVYAYDSEGEDIALK